MIRGGVSSTPGDVLAAYNIASSTSLLVQVCHSVTESRDSVFKSASPVECFGVRSACFKASLFSLLDVASSPSAFWIGGVSSKVGHFIATKSFLHLVR